MALKVGGADVQDVKLGATQVAKVMLGAEQVWPTGPQVVGEWTYRGQQSPGDMNALGLMWQHEYRNNPRAQLRFKKTDELGTTFTSWTQLAPGGTITLRRKSDGLTVSWTPAVLVPWDINPDAAVAEATDLVNDAFPFDVFTDGDRVELLV